MTPQPCHRRDLRCAERLRAARAGPHHDWASCCSIALVGFETSWNVHNSRLQCLPGHVAEAESGVVCLLSRRQLPPKISSQRILTVHLRGGISGRRSRAEGHAMHPLLFDTLPLYFVMWVCAVVTALSPNGTANIVFLARALNGQTSLENIPGKGDHS